MTNQLSADEQFIACFAAGDLASARKLVQNHSELLEPAGYKAHPLLRQAVLNEGGRCVGQARLEIGDLLTSPIVTALRDAVAADHVEQVRDQLGSKPTLIDCEFATERGITQLIHCWQSVAMGELLLDQGADINALTTVHSIGDTPLSLQLRYGNEAGVRLLLKRGADPNRGILKQMPSENLSVFLDLLLVHGWNINEGAGMRTLLHHDANHGHGNRIRVLLEHGADPNVRDSIGQTPLHVLAARGAGEAAIRALVDVGADLDAQDDAGLTPLAVAQTAPKQIAARTLAELGAAIDRGRN